MKDPSPQNELERIMIKAASSREYHDMFYRIFVGSDIYGILSKNQVLPRRQNVLGVGDKLALQFYEVDGKTFLPFFTTENKIKEIVNEEVSCIRGNALEFLKITKGVEILLNPETDYCKHFTKAEIQFVIENYDWDIVTRSPTEQQ